MAFSGALTLTDLNDFISPSQACIKPVEHVNKPKENEGTGARTEIVVDTAGSYYEVSNDGLGASGAATTSREPTKASGEKLEQAQINLNDCLACSGCITSAESVLITLQSHTEVFNFIETNKSVPPESQKILVLSVAPQSLASLAASLSVTPRQILRRVRRFFTQVLGFSQVLDTTFARHIALREHLLEYDERKTKDRLGGEAAEGQLPMLASACPGWICYAEKAHSEMLPFISQTKSPQQIMGSLVKEWMGKKWGKKPDGVYHVSVMPCYDKKLEASRQDFYNEMYSTRDVDCVITTGELDLMMKGRDWDLSATVPNELDDPLPPTSTDGDLHLPELLQHPGSSSGSYLQSIINHIIETSPTPLSLSRKIMRNADYEEFTLIEEASGKAVFKGAKCYGFRNLQNVVRKVGRDKGVRVGGGAAGKLGGKAVAGGIGRRIARKGGVSVSSGEGSKQYDYVEVMACPGGCVNGGGQLKPVASAQQSSLTSSTFNSVAAGDKDEEGFTRNWDESGMMQSSAKWGDKNWTAKVERVYWSMPRMSSSSVQQVKARGRNEEAERCDGKGERGDRVAKVQYHSEGSSTKASQYGSVSILNGADPHDSRVAPAVDISGEEQLTSVNMRGDLDGVDSVKTKKTEAIVDEDGLDPGVWPREQREGLVRQLAFADELTGRIIQDLCRPPPSESRRSREDLFRTKYHAVESDVIGLAVKW
ncbi:iron hydrogenase [Coprinopsis marcescibilis]|uniref:Iron hydrogenase n=1 Tax=Coprinopsis marcescibilis TaxID=230819 RepID=A0A5C3L186_COPMA|nr:iron hydrogenase [Coprinopsis marcescibilis]